MVRKAIKVPAKAIINNSGDEGAVVVGRLLEQSNSIKGYDSANHKYVDDMYASGIIDPTLVVKTALE